MTEKELQDRMAIYLSRFFNVEKEVCSTDYKKRIDMVMIHKSDTLSLFPVGIEIKTDDKKTGSNLGKWLNQAIEYTKKEFIGYGKIHVITYPQIAGQCLEEGKLMHPHNVYEYGDFACQHNVNSFLAQFEIGELQKFQFNDKNHVRIVFNSRLLWSSHNDIFRNKYYKFGCKK